MKPILILLLSISLQAENIICLNAIDDMILAIESNDKTKAIQLTDIIVKECEDIEAIELAKKMKWELEKWERLNLGCGLKRVKGFIW